MMLCHLFSEKPVDGDREFIAQSRDLPQVEGVCLWRYESHSSEG